ncbi:anti-sigma factor antagonist [Umezawaea tangerina]|uniref:Anti-sigma factor antagonist n=1 Tax=Umezawaea tangerina TaxID=84725 RepID=A0A2T0SWR1_9PSEU|nr:anti-sigma factor antagonist [Umezawaea tangerina]PRY37852.1 anti-anti-sigma factor [Umezawaea tangerina]
MATEQTDLVETEGTETITGRQEVRDGAVLLTVAGEVDATTAPKLRTWMDEAFATDASPVVLDLSGVTFFGSVGLAMLVEYTERGDLRTVAPSRAVAAPIYLTTLDQVLKLYPDVEGALKTC